MRKSLKSSLPRVRDQKKVEDTVREMLSTIRLNPDTAIRDYALKLDKWDRSEFRVSQDEIRKATRELPETFKEDFALCLRNVGVFAKRQLESISAFEAELTPGVILGQKLIPVENVGCYIP